MNRVFYIFFILISVSLQAQDRIFGKILNENESPINNVLVINMNTKEIAYSDTEGNFSISATKNEELRFVKKGYERNAYVLKSDYTTEILIKLAFSVTNIEEVKIGFVPTGNIKKDSKALNPSEKVQKFNREMITYLKKPPTIKSPRLQPPSTLVQGPNFTAGQVDILKLAKGIKILVDKATKEEPTTANFVEQQRFFERIKSEIDMQFYAGYGLDEYDFEALLLYADKKYHLAKLYREKFDIKIIDGYLRSSLKEFLNTKENG